MTCPNCGENEAHFVPPSFGQVGFFMCHDKECALGPGTNKGSDGCTCHLSRPVPFSRTCARCGAPAPYYLCPECQQSLEEK